MATDMKDETDHAPDSPHSLKSAEAPAISHESEKSRPAPNPSYTFEHDASLLREILVIGLISLAQLTTQMGLGQCLSIIHVIGDTFAIDDPGVLSWLIAGYSLTVGTFILFSGRIGDLFGWKEMLIIGYCWYGLWSIIAGLAWYSNHVLFVFARVLSGIGPAICLPNGLALLGALYGPGKKKNMAFAVFGATAPVGFVIGAVFAGLWALTWWPWTFMSFGIALFIIAIASFFIIPDPQDDKPGLHGKSVKEALADLDLLGATVGITALILVNFAWNQAPIVGWNNAYIIVTLVLGVILFPVFLWLELSVVEFPLIPRQVFTSENAFVLACISCGWANFGIWMYYLYQILQQLRGLSPLLTIAYLCPLALSGMCAAILTGIFIGKLGPAWVMTIAMCAFLTGTILVATLPVYQVYWAQIFVCTLITPFGMDMSFPSATLVVSNAQEKRHQGVAASLVNTIVNYSISLGLGIAGTVEVHVNRGGLTPEDKLAGYHGALYFSIGLAGLGVLLAIVFVLKSYHDKSKRKDGATTPAA